MWIFPRKKLAYNVGKTGTKQNKMQGSEMQKLLILSLKWTSKFRDTLTYTQGI